MLVLRLQAQFAAFRTFTAGWYRPTAGFLTPSAAYGLALNLAGEETRRDDGISAMTVTRFGLPPARIAIGADPDHPLPTVQALFQQLHNYPVGASGKERKDDAKGSKYTTPPSAASSSPASTRSSRSTSAICTSSGTSVAKKRRPELTTRRFGRRRRLHSPELRESRLLVTKW